MNIIQRVIQWAVLKANEGAAALGGDEGGNPFAIWAGNGKKVSAAKAMAAYTGWVYACVRAIAEEIAGMRFKVMKIKKDGSVEELPTSELADALEAVNNEQTGYAFRFKIAAHLELCGNAFIYLDGVNGPLDKPTAMYILNPSRVRVITTEDTFPKRLLSFKYREGVREYTFQPYQILHIPALDPSEEFEGIGTVQSIGGWIDADNAALDVNQQYFKNGARIGGFLETDATLTPPQMEYLKKSFDAIHKGVDNAYKTAALPRGVKFTAGSTSPKDMDFTNMGIEMAKRILAGFRVPKSVLGITEDVNRANAEATNYIFGLRTIKPKMQLIAAYLNEFFVPRYGKDIYLDFEDPVPENVALKLEEMKVATGGHPILTPNEAREIYFGQEPLEGGDELQSAPAAVPGAPAQLSQPSDKKVTKTKDKKVKVVKLPKTMYRRNAEKREGLSEAFADAAEKALKELTEKEKATRTKTITEMTKADWDVLQKTLQNRMKPYEEKVAESIRKHNNKQASTVKANLGRATKAKRKGINADELFNMDNEVRATVELVSPELTELYKKEGIQAGALLGAAELNLLDNEILRAALEKSINLMARSYNETTLEALKSVLEKGINEGATLGQLTDLVATTYEDWNDWRAAAVATTEVFRVANTASKDAWKETGVVKTIKWHTSDDELTCQYCAPLDGKIISIDDNFFKKGDKLTGTDGGTLDLSYASVGSPPLHPNCRCTTAPEDISIND